MGNKLESSFKNMVLVLFVVTLIVSAAVGYVYTLTAGPIDDVKKNKKIDAIKTVIPGKFDNDPSADSWKVAAGENNEAYAYLYTAKEPDSLEVYPAKLNGELVGTAVRSFSNNGFGGQVWVMVGFTPDGKVHNYSVLEHKETPGLGTEMVHWFLKGGKGDITGKNPGEKPLSVTKDGGDIDAITAATISSRAFLDAVNRAAGAISGSADAYSGATSH
ncbi:RnfABCDGE type electron transport complex subunit G [Porphyromonadaceae bacterium OttesenSCG-928-L07]|nr:RnfABCDGE type electron transport complex subunit G [Porphyromonadaceae bacterium OttesenSCG-928-L07]MDL2252038.1 RnfABCDGE type electron transport complex subunit G [Odoribacter sp. OttesenSCG-928-J03]MDL2331153.1 RnfABCDGE type electron transport complex subunit G [Odoribacter sp. OttesenSCG-928-A06]